MRPNNASRASALLRGLALIVVSLAVLIWASLRANAAWQYLAASRIAEPQLSAESVDQTAVDKAEIRIQRALALFPQNPDYLVLAGQLQELRARQTGLVGGKRTALLHAAAAYYRQAIAVRPLWPYSWANLLGAKSRLGQVDAEFRRALLRSAETGPWEPRVQLQLLESGLQFWEQLGSKERSLVIKVLANALTRQPREVFELVQSFRRPDLLCPLKTPQPQIENYCRSALARE